MSDDFNPNGTPGAGDPFNPDGTPGAGDPFTPGSGTFTFSPDLSAFIDSLRDLAETKTQAAMRSDEREELAFFVNTLGKLGTIAPPDDLSDTDRADWSQLRARFWRSATTRVGQILDAIDDLNADDGEA